MNIITYICKRANSSILELALSIGTGYPLIGCSPAEPISVLPVLINITNLITDTVQFTLPYHLEIPYSQDSDKENYILCSDCELYFSVLETYCATRLHNRLWNRHFKDEFILKINDFGVSWKVCRYMSNSIFRLFIYSIVWRCSVSSAHTFHRFNLLPDEEIKLQICLKKCIVTSQSNLINLISDFEKLIPSFPFVIFTSESFSDKTRHLIFCEPGKRNPYFLTLNEYVLIFSFDFTEIFPPELNNFKPNELIKIGFFPEEFWINMLNNANQKFIKKVMENLKQNEQVPFFMKNEINN